MYSVRFPSVSIRKEFDKALSKVSRRNQLDIMEKVERLARDPRPFGQKFFKCLNPPMELYQLTAQYRLRVGDYRVLYDVDDKKRVVWILALRKRDERTYQ